MNFIKSLAAELFSVFFPTKVTRFGRSLFYITNENDYIARQTRIGRLDDCIVYNNGITKTEQ